MNPDFDKREEDTICFNNDDCCEGEVVNHVPHEVTRCIADGRTITGKWIWRTSMRKRDEDIPPVEAPKKIG